MSPRRAYSIRAILSAFDSMTIAAIREEAYLLGIVLRFRHTRREIKEALEFALERQNELDVQAARNAAHRAERCLELRQQTAPDPSCLDYPFAHIHEYAPTPTPIIGQTDLGLPTEWWKTVEHYYWIHGGMNDEEPWRFLARLQNGHYVFFIANCDYTGFDCQGDMKVWVAESPGILIMYGMSNTDYDLFIEETSRTSPTQI